MTTRRKVTLTDIAKACGVSRATVSLVLRGSPLVHADTRARVEQDMRRQGYVYNRAAANLRQQLTNYLRESSAVRAPGDDYRRAGQMDFRDYDENDEEF